MVSFFLSFFLSSHFKYCDDCSVTYGGLYVSANQSSYFFTQSVSSQTIKVQLDPRSWSGSPIYLVPLLEFQSNFLARGELPEKS